MGNNKVAILGGGLVAELLAFRLSKSWRKVIIDPSRARASALADEVGGIAADQPSAVRGCSILFVTASGTASERLLADAAPHVESGALVVNMAQDLSTAQVAAALPGVRLASAKVIGTERALRQGAAAVVVLQAPGREEEDLLAGLLEGIGSLVTADESVAAAVTTAAEAVLREAEGALRARLSELGLSRDTVERMVAAIGMDLGPRPAGTGIGLRTI